MKSFGIAEHQLSPDSPVYLIAEVGVNHDGSYERAIELAVSAAGAGVNAVKFQTFTAEHLAAPSAGRFPYLDETSVAESQYELLKRLELSDREHAGLKNRCEELGVDYLSTPFSLHDLKRLESLDPVAIKLGSGELNNPALLQAAGDTGRPVILSTGMGTLGEVEAAVEAVTRSGNKQLVLLHCVSRYPAPAETANLRAMETLRTAFGFPVGFSDHTEGIEVALAAIALGAVVLEKHFTYDRQAAGPDHSASIEVDELRRLVTGARKVRVAMGDARKRPVVGEDEIAAVARKSLVLARPVETGIPLSAHDLEIKRPGSGLPPGSISYVIGRSLNCSRPAGHLLQWNDLA